MTQLPNVLIVEDDSDWLEIYTLNLKSKKYKILPTQTIEDAQETLEQHEIAVVATDLKLLESDTGGFDILEIVRARSSCTQVIIFTGVGGEKEAREARRRGACDYLTKPLDYPTTIRVINSAIGMYEQKKSHQFSKSKLIGDSKEIKEVFERINSVIKSSESVLIWGGSGTGKTLIVETILSGKRDHFQVINCTNYSEEILEQTLYGLHKGTIAGGGEGERGTLQLASGGTLVLDTIDFLSPRLQKFILSTFFKGYPRINIRILATSQADLRLYVDEGLFLKELYDCLAQSVIRVPALKERKDAQIDDVFILINYFLKKYTPIDRSKPTISKEASNLLQAYDFPGNVRELEEAIRIAIVRAKSGIIEPQHLPEQIQHWQRSTMLEKVIRSPLPDNVICPHGYSLTNQAKEIAQTFYKEMSVYLLVDVNTPTWYQTALEDVFAQFGLKLYSSTTFSSSADVCLICQPLLSTHLAIFDITTLKPSIMYQLGIAHTAGVQCAILKRKGSQIPEDLGRMVLLEYYDETSLRQAILTWLYKLSEITQK